MIVVEQIETHFKQRITKLDAQYMIKEAMEYALISNGKYIRPLTFLRFIKTEKISEIDALDIAMAIECIHVYSLVHDDLPAMDDDDLRRGKPTVHKKFREDIAILTGDALLTLAFELLANLEMSANKKVELIKILSQCAGVNGGMINGQVLDILGDGAIDLDYLNQVHIQKTAKMLIAPLEMGAVINESSISSAYELGYILGLTYQIQDDYLDVYGDEKLLGKTVGSDQTNGKTTYISFYEKQQLEELIENNFKKIEELLEVNKASTQLKNLILGLDKRSF